LFAYKYYSKSETDRSDPESVSITKRAPLSFQRVRPTAPIVSVLDGDTIEVLHNQHPECIRLNDIDCKLSPTVTDSNENLSGTGVAQIMFGKRFACGQLGRDSTRDGMWVR
jgi:endonuclease YncB( thermonuclease family)